MSSVCAGCKGPILDANFIKCSKCAKFYDFSCINISKEKFKGFSQSYKDQWLCPSCTCSRPKGDNTSTPIRASTAVTASDDTHSSENINTTRGSRQVSKTKISRDDPTPNPGLVTLIAELRQLRLEVTEVKQQNTEIKNQMSLISENLSQNFQEHTKKLQNAEEEIIILKATVGELQLKLAARVQLAEADIEDVVRVGPKTRRQSKSPSSPRPPRPIVLKLLRRRKTEELLKAAKARRNLTTEKLVDGNPTPIFFNERLTHYNRQLFREARKRSKENQFQYCWIKNGGIYVRKSDGMAAMRIRTAAELDEKVGPASQHADVENITL
ncbi:hypothetical protein ACJJTC_010695 [Scirpophaga incertulas]